MLAIIRSLPGNFMVLVPNLPHFTIVEVSDEFAKATLTNREKIIGANIFNVFPDDPADEFADGVKNLAASFHTVLSTKQSHEMAVQRYPVENYGDGTFVEKYWATINKPVIVNGEVIYIIHTVTEVTESRLLKSREKYFKTLAEGSPFMIWRSAGASCVYVNDAWISTTGLSLADSLGSGLFKAMHPEDRDEQRRLFNNAVLNQNDYEAKFRILNRTGETRWVFMKVVPHLIGEATVEFIGSMIDITEQEIAAQKLEESERQLRQLADSIIQMIWVTDPNGMHEYYNQRWYDFTGTSYEDTEGEGWNHVFHPDDRERAWKVWRHSLETGAPYEIEYRLRKYTGEYVWVLGRAAPFHDSDGNIVKWFGTCTDINEQKLSQQRRDDFLNIASHELKTPLTSLTANIQLLEKLIAGKRELEGIIPNLVSASSRNIKKLNKLVGDLLNVNSIASGKLSVRHDWFDLVETIRNATTYLSSVSIPVRLTGASCLSVLADESKIEQVIINFFNNAIKYAPESKFIEINVRDEHDVIRVSVIDQGYGIQLEKQRFLFDRYYQAENSDGKYSGMGLGLYICGNIIRGHDGDIGVESEPGSGSRFWFTLPKSLERVT